MRTIAKWLYVTGAVTVFVTSAPTIARATAFSAPPSETEAFEAQNRLSPSELIAERRARLLYQFTTRLPEQLSTLFERASGFPAKKVTTFKGSLKQAARLRLDELLQTAVIQTHDEGDEEFTDSDATELADLILPRAGRTSPPSEGSLNRKKTLLAKLPSDRDLGEGVDAAQRFADAFESKLWFYPKILSTFARIDFSPPLTKTKTSGISESGPDQPRALTTRDIATAADLLLGLFSGGAAKVEEAEKAAKDLFLYGLGVGGLSEVEARILAAKFWNDGAFLNEKWRKKHPALANFATQMGLLRVVASGAQGGEGGADFQRVFPFLPNGEVKRHTPVIFGDLPFESISFGDTRTLGRVIPLKVATDPGGLEWLLFSDRDNTLYGASPIKRTRSGGVQLSTHVSGIYTRPNVNNLKWSGLKVHHRGK